MKNIGGNKASETGKVNEEHERKGTFVTLDPGDLDMMKVLKDKHSINISSLVRNTIRNLYKKMESEVS